MSQPSLFVSTSSLQSLNATGHVRHQCQAPDDCASFPAIDAMLKIRDKIDNNVSQVRPFSPTFPLCLMFSTLDTHIIVTLRICLERLRVTSYKSRRQSILEVFIVFLDKVDAHSLSGTSNTVINLRQISRTMEL